jgi:hypothetical protein
MGELITAMAARPFAALGWPQNEVDSLVASARKDLEDRRFHTYFEYLFWTAQKPEVGKAADAA